MILHKFGGSSLASAEKMHNVATILNGREEAVVVSASGKTTRNLQQAIDTAVAGGDYTAALEVVLAHHKTIITTLMPQDTALYEMILQDLRNIKHILSTIAITTICPSNLRFFILGYGEIWSAQILTAYMCHLGHNALFVDASEHLIVNDARYPVAVDWHKSQVNIAQFTQSHPADVYIITGFIAQNIYGKRTILGLNCSDYSAAIFAKLMHAQKLYIWTDVAGVYSANPQVVPEAQALKALTYKEALELAYFGASVVHPLTINPMMQENTPIYIKSSFAPQEEGTIISGELDQNQGLIKGLTSVGDVAMVRIQGAGMIGVSGIAAKVFNALDKENVSVMMISQASSEYSICCAVTMAEADKAVEVLQAAFEQEALQGLIEEIIAEKHYALITAVGEGMKSQAGAAAKLMHSLAQAKVNIHAIAQGSSERSITIAVKADDEVRGLRAMHRQYYTPSHDVVIALAGVGNIGSSLIQQLKQAQRYWAQQGVNLHLVAVANSKQMRLSRQHNLLNQSLKQIFDNSEVTDNDISTMVEFVSGLNASKKVFIDATANPSIAQHYLPFLDRGISVITPNKYANTGELNYYDALRHSAHKHHGQFLYETNVCAGLPLIRTLQDMRQSGDQVQSIQGIFSGTLSYLFSQLNQGMLFSTAVKQAYDLGYTEPDPREDLSGMDVARKTVCLAREMGLRVDISDLEIENLVPQALRDVSVTAFFEQLPQYDNEITAHLQAKKGQGIGVHYLGSIQSNGQIAVGIQSYTSADPFANAQGTDNIVLIYSQRYSPRPMVIQGAGAGAEVTAAGIFADLIRVIR